MSNIKDFFAQDILSRVNLLYSMVPYRLNER